MNALELAVCVDADVVTDYGEVTAMLRAQHKAIKTLREALHSISRMSYAASAQERVATAALAATEELK